MDQYERIRNLYAIEGLSQRQIARMLGISRHTVARYCTGENLPGVRKPCNRQPNVVTPEIIAFIEQCFREDAELGRSKQRHTAHRIYTRLYEEKGFTGAESTIRRAVREFKEKIPARASVPLHFAPAEAAQVDWGQATVFIAGQKVTSHMLCMRLCNSAAPFVITYPNEREEAFLDGQRRAFEFFGGVPGDLIYDNLKTAVKEGWGKNAREQDKLKVFAAHYAYTARFCNPGKGNEKGLVEDLVGFCRRNFLVPAPHFNSWEELNSYLAKQCQQYIDKHQIRGREQSVKEAFLQEKSVLTRLPITPYDAARAKEARVDHFATVVYETNHYSVPVNSVGKMVSLRITPFNIDIYYRGNKIASHSRSYEKQKTYYQMEHYLPLIKERPRAVFNARPVKAAGLPCQIEAYARKLADAEKGMVRLLTLVIEHGIDNVTDAINRAENNEHYSVDLVQYYLNQDKVTVRLPITGPQVMPVDLTAYDALLTGGLPA